MINYVLFIAYRAFLRIQYGFSVHTPHNTNLTLIALPGYDSYRGQVVVYNYSEKAAEILGKNFDSYFSYTMTSAYFIDPNNVSTLMYIVSAPRENLIVGEVAACASHENKTKVVYRFVGSKIGEYFGYAIVADDFNADGFTDVVVSAPFCTIKSFNEGCVYVFKFERKSKKQLPFRMRRLTVSNENGDRAQFGMALALLGDINQDGFNGITIYIHNTFYCLK